MTRRKRARQEASFYEVQESFRENARLLTMLQHSFTSSSSSNSANEDATESRRRSPESVLYESPQMNLLQCREELSPEIVPTISRVKLKPEDAHEDDDAEEIGEEAAAEKIQQSESTLFKTGQVDLLLCHEQLNSEVAFGFSKIKEPDLRTDYENNDGRRKRIERPVPDSRSDYHQISDQVSDAKHEKRSLLENEWSPERDNHYDATKMDDCYLLNKTLSMNDDLACEMDKYFEDEELSTITTAATSCRSIVKTTSPLDVAIDELQSKYVAKPARSASLQKSGKYDHKFGNDVQSSLDEFEPLESSICESFDAYDRMCGDNMNQMRGQKPGRDDKSYEVASEKDGRSSVTTWREFRKVFTYLQQLNRKIRGENAKCGTSLFSRHRFARDDRRFRYVSITTPPSSSSLVSSRVSLSPKNSKKNRKSSAFANCNTRLMNERRSKFDESPQRAKRIEPNPCRQGSITPRSGSSPSAYRCRGILKFEDENEEAKGEQREPATVRAEVTNNSMLPQRESNSEGHSYPLNLPSCFKTSWVNCSPSESTLTSSVDLLAAPDYNYCGRHPRKVEYQDGTCKRHISQNITTLRDSPEHSFQRRDIPSMVIRKIATFCIWLYKKLLRLLDNSYKKLRRRIVSSSSSSQDILSQSPRTKEFSHLMVTLRSENDKMLCTMSDKVARLSTDFMQIRTSIEAVLGTVTAEVDNVREISKKMNENNITLMQELKKLHEALEEIQSKSSRRVSSTTSCFSSSRPPAPLPPSSPPPLSFTLPLKHATESTSLVQLLPPPPPPSLPPPPPPLPPSLPSVCFQSPMSSVIPTTPNNSKINKSNVTPTSKCSTPLLNRPSITVEDLLKVTLKKAPQSIKENRRNTVPGPRGPVVSLDMLRNVKLKSARRRNNDQTGRSPRNGRIAKSRTVSTLSLSPITAGSESNLERILRQVDINRRGPRRLLSGSVSFRDHDFAKDDARSQSLETLKHSQSQSAIA